MGGTLTAWLAALHYWFPKVTGRMYPERWGFVAATLITGGFFTTFFPQFLLGNAGMPRRYYDYDPQFQALHVISTVGSWILGGGMLITLLYLTIALFTGDRAPPNPWDSRSFEWRTASPPPTHNFDASVDLASAFTVGPRLRVATARTVRPRRGPRRGGCPWLRRPRRTRSTSRTSTVRRTRRASGCGSF